MEHPIPRHIRLTSHPGSAGTPIPLRWGAADPAERGPVVASPAEPRRRNAIGSHSGAYGIYRALAVATKALARDHRPDLTDTAPAALIAPAPQWADPGQDRVARPVGASRRRGVCRTIRDGVDVRPTIAITTARIAMPEIRAADRRRGLMPDGRVLLDNGEIRVTKAAIDPVWHLPGLAARFGVAETRFAPHPVRGNRRHVPRTRHPARSRSLAAADRRHDGLSLWRGRADRRPGDGDRLPRPRRMQRLGCVRLGHLHLPALSGARRRGLRRDRAAGRGRHHRLQPQGGPRRSARSPNSSSTTRASASRAATAPTPISAAPNASPGCRICAFRN